MKKRLSTVLLGALITGSVSAADSDVKVGANFDMNYLYNKDIQTRNDGTNLTNSLPGLDKSNDANEVNVSEVFVSFSGTVKNLDWYVEANLGGENATNDANWVNRAWLSHNFNEMLSVTAGRMSTNVGNESYMAKDNWNYTRSWLFQTTPDWANGVVAAYDFKNGLTASYGMLESPIQNDAENEGKAHHVQVGFSRDRLNAEVNYLQSESVMGTAVADGAFTHIDVNATYEINSQFSAGVIYAMGSGDIAAKGTESEYTDWAILAKYKATEQFWAAVRYEQFEEEVQTGGTFFFSNNSTVGTGIGAATGNANDFASTTLTLAYDMMNGSEFRLEGRMDKSDAKVFTNDDGATDDSSTTIALAWLFRI